MDLPSDSDESDVDFVPEGENSNSDAESEGDADKETEEQYENELAKKILKRAANCSKKGPRKKAKLDEEDILEKPKENKINPVMLDPEQAKKYEDDLWASFLDTPSQSNKATASKDETPKQSVMNKEEKVEENGNERSVPDKDKNVEVNKPEEHKPSSNTSGSSVLNKGRSSLPPSLPFGRKPAGGLASVLNKIGKKDKLSTLEKSKLDWMSFKKEEGIDEEIKTHNRGKAGYLERQDFLQRTDVKQFEIERNLRLNKRSSR